MKITKPFTLYKDNRTEPHNAPGMAQKLRGGSTQVKNSLQLGTLNMLSIHAALAGANIHDHGRLGPNSDSGI